MSGAGRVDAYSRLAAVYDEIVVDPCHARWAAFLHELWSSDAEGVRSVLDLCCGTGLLAEELIAEGYSLVGIDASDAMLALARERLGPGQRCAGWPCPTFMSKGCSTRPSTPSTVSTTSIRRTCG